LDYASAARPASPEARICPFLRGIADDGVVGAPVRWPDSSNRCTALGDLAPQSLRQQEYACLASSHLNCPLFVRGEGLRARPAERPEGGSMRLTPAILAALLVLAASFALSVGFVVANGGMDLPMASGSSPEAGVQSPRSSPAPSASPDVASGAPSPEPGSSPSATASIAAETAEPSVAPTASPSSAPTPGPSSDRYALLEPCGDAPDCWIYTIRSGDNLVSIARYFGVPFDTVVELNPWTETTQLVAGQELRLPPPTR
jgi:cell division septation protein DedD